MEGDTSLVGADVGNRGKDRAFVGPACARACRRLIARPGSPVKATTLGRKTTLRCVLRYPESWGSWVGRESARSPRAWRNAGGSGCRAGRGGRIGPGRRLAQGSPSRQIAIAIE